MKMRKIKLDITQGYKDGVYVFFKGFCKVSELYWKDYETDVNPLRWAGQFSTKKEYRENYHEKWFIEGIDGLVDISKKVYSNNFVEYSVLNEESDSILCNLYNNLKNTDKALEILEKN